MAVSLYQQQSANIRKTWLIMFLFTLFITTLAYVYGKASGFGLSYAGIALLISGFMSIGSYFFSDKLVLATTGAREIKEEDYPEYYRTVENLAIANGLPMPRVYVMDDPSPNAFATGRDYKHAVVCATTGILQILNKAELEGVIAHELSHVKNYDIRLMAVVSILVGSIAIIADMFMRSMWFGGGRRDDDNRGGNNGIFIIIGIIFAILSPVIATLIQPAVSRRRECLADASGALLTRYPEGLASALEKISASPRPLSHASNATAHLFIANPFKDKEGKAWLASLFNTHPPMEERIKILRAM